jgi:hypothetical protein
MDFLETMGPQQACKKFGCEVKPLNGYKDPTEDGRVRCVGSAIWNGREQIVPWVAGWGDLYATYAHPGFYGAGMIGTCAEYYQIALYQFDEYY